MSASGQQFRFICDADQEKKLLRVITFADGKVVNRQLVPEGILFTIQKT